VVREKAFLISQVLDETNVETSSSMLGIEGFKKLISEVKKPKPGDESGTFHEKRSFRI
jgi:hypothetical protein